MGLLFSGSTGALGGGTTATERVRGQSVGVSDVCMGQSLGVKTVGQSVIGNANSSTHFKTSRRVRGVEFES